MITEKEAEAKWCPFTRSSSERSAGATHNRPDGSYNCIGSACMAWRIVPNHETEENKYQDERPEGEGWARSATPGSLWWSRPIDQQARGYCGLVGRPEP